MYQPAPIVNSSGLNVRFRSFQRRSTRRLPIVADDARPDFRSNHQAGYRSSTSMLRSCALVPRRPTSVTLSDGVAGECANHCQAARPAHDGSYFDRATAKKESPESAVQIPVVRGSCGENSSNSRQIFKGQRQVSIRAVQNLAQLANGRVRPICADSPRGYP